MQGGRPDDQNQAIGGQRLAFAGYGLPGGPAGQAQHAPKR
jgi:hypothetical protein